MDIKQEGKYGNPFAMNKGLVKTKTITNSQK